MNQMEIYGATDELLAIERTRNQARQGGGRTFEMQLSPEAMAVMNAAPQILEKLDSISRSGVEVFQCARDMYIAGKELDAMVDIAAMRTSASLQKFSKSLPMIERTIDKYSDKLNDVIDRIMMMDPSECSLEVAKYRSQLIDIAHGHNQTIQSVLMKMLSI